MRLAGYAEHMWEKRNDRISVQNLTERDLLEGLVLDGNT
jgi:hypothetical protein